MGDFHFLRPGWLLLVFPAAFLVWRTWRRHDATQTWRGIIAPHLLPFLLSGQASKSRLGPVHLIAIGWLAAIVAIAGPTWRHEPSPFADDTAAMAIVVNVSPSMKTEDVQPDRLTRAVQKIHDILAARGDAKTALIAYAGSAHRVMPATTDAGIIDTFAQALDPKIMPAPGDAAAEALDLADQTLMEAEGGSILWITDSISSDQMAALEAWRRKSQTPVRLLAPLLPGSELDSLSNAAHSVNASVIRLATDDSDATAIARAAKFTNVTGTQLGDHWQEAGYFLTPLIALLLLPFFRKGWIAGTGARA